MADNGFSRGQAVFMAALLLAGLGLLGWAGYRALYPPRQGPDLAEQAEEYLQKRGSRPLSDELEELINDRTFKPRPTESSPLLNQDAPDFTLPAVGGEKWTMSKRKAGPLLLVFYYGYHCDHCVAQLFALNKDIKKFNELGAEVVAVSADSPALTRKRFKQYGPFQFTVLSDDANKVAQTYGAYRPGKDGQEGELSHATFVISRQGKVVWAYKGDQPFTDHQTLLVVLSKAR